MVQTKNRIKYERLTIKKGESSIVHREAYAKIRIPIYSGVLQGELLDIHP
jgi:hypothetical protein